MPLQGNNDELNKVYILVILKLNLDYNLKQHLINY
ncbi:hypothetical protein C8C85_1327 [Flavobacterium sp. 103]|nr:hypothetical protein C8C85_1327 [Flavobacterium sp. 103]